MGSYICYQSQNTEYSNHKDAPLNHIHLPPALSHPQSQVPYPDIYLSPISKILSFFEMLHKESSTVQPLGTGFFQLG